MIKGIWRIYPTGDRVWAWKFDNGDPEKAQAVTKVVIHGRAETKESWDTGMPPQYLEVDGEMEPNKTMVTFWGQTWMKQRSGGD